MSSGRHRLARVVGFGGAAVMGTYLYGILAWPDTTAQLWEVVPEAIRPPYLASIGLATVGFFAGIYFNLICLDPKELVLPGGLGYWVFGWLYALILIPSALYVPLGIAMVQEPTPGIWMALRLVLGLVGLGALGLLGALLTLRPRGPARSYRLALVGSIFFAFHTAVVDAVLWPILFIS